MSNTQTATGDTATRQGNSRQRIAAIAAATVATVVVWLLANSVFDVDIKVTSNDSETAVQLPAVAIATLVSGLLAWALLAVLERKTSAPRTAWTVTAGIVTVLSLLGPLGGVSASAKATLVCLHVVAALVLIPGLARTVRRS